jgi:hypothetical protein
MTPLLQPAAHRAISKERFLVARGAGYVVAPRFEAEEEDVDMEYLLGSGLTGEENPTRRT